MMKKYKDGWYGARETSLAAIGYCIIDLRVCQLTLGLSAFIHNYYWGLKKNLFDFFFLESFRLYNSFFS